MKRAVVWRGRPNRWWAEVCPAEHYRDRRAITARVPVGAPAIARPFPTHAAALAYALAEVGLTEKNTEKEKNR